MDLIVDSSTALPSPPQFEQLFSARAGTELWISEISIRGLLASTDSEQQFVVFSPFQNTNELYSAQHDNLEGSLKYEIAATFNASAIVG